MNKEIITDGVNVAGCKFLNSNSFCREEGYYEDCKDKNCIYKQLQRKEQECEKLREANDEKNEFLQKLGISATGEFHRIKHYIDKLHQEYEELKKELEHTNICYQNAAKFSEEYSDKANRYEQALKKIEEILTYYANSSMGVKNIDGTFSLKNEQEAIILNYDPRRAQEGLKIIKEVKE